MIENTSYFECLCESTHLKKKNNEINMKQILGISYISKPKIMELFLNSRIATKRLRRG